MPLDRQAWCECDSFACSLALDLTWDEFEALQEEFPGCFITNPTCATDPVPGDELVKETEKYRVYRPHRG